MFSIIKSKNMSLAYDVIYNINTIVKKEDPLLKNVYEEEFERAMGEDRDRSSFTVTPEYQYFRSN